jgi:hypothetical protein
MKVKPERDQNRRISRRKNWWLFGENQPKMRAAISGLGRFIATTDTSRHRIFQFIEEKTVCDDKVVICASSDAFLLGVLSARVHCVWANSVGVRLGVGNDPVYASNRCFEPFPFPLADGFQKQRVRAIAEEIDSHRKRVIANNANLSLTSLYNVLEQLRAGKAREDLGNDGQRILDQGLIFVLGELHQQLDAVVSEIYGWPNNISDEEILVRLVALNEERAMEEATGTVHWLRPEYQVPRIGSSEEKAQLDLVGGATSYKEVSAIRKKPAFPIEEIAQTAAVMAALGTAAEPLDAETIAGTFRQGRRVTSKVGSVLKALSRMGFVIASEGGKVFRLQIGS